MVPPPLDMRAAGPVKPLPIRTGVKAQNCGMAMGRVMNDPSKGGRWCDPEIMGESASSQLMYEYLARHLSTPAVRQDLRGSLRLGHGIGITHHVMTLPKHGNAWRGI